MQRFAEEYRIEILNVAGSRESKEPGIYQWVTQVLDDALFWAESHPGAIGGPREGWPGRAHWKQAPPLPRTAHWRPVHYVPEAGVLLQKTWPEP